MSNPCYYHPAAAAVGNCIQCGTPGCGDCLENVGGRPACRRCADALKSKLTAQAAPPPLAPQFGTPPAPAAAYNPNAGLNYASTPYDYVDTTPVEPLKTNQLLMGIGLATGVGLLGAIGIEKILVATHFGLPFLYIFLGAAVASCLRAFTHRGGQTMALIALGVFLICLAGGHAVYVQDAVNEARAQGDDVTFSQMLPLAMANLKFKHWIFVIGGLILCAVTANRESKPGF